MAIRDAANAVFAPAVGARPCVIVREIFPSGPARAVVFAYRTPLALGEIRSPALPVFFACSVFLEPLVFRRLASGHGLEPLNGRAQIMVYGRIFCESGRRPVQDACPFRQACEKRNDTLMIGCFK